VFESSNVRTSNASNNDDADTLQELLTAAAFIAAKEVKKRCDVNECV
jgi:hypothetical protein